MICTTILISLLLACSVAVNVYWLKLLGKYSILVTDALRGMAEWKKLALEWRTLAFRYIGFEECPEEPGQKADPEHPTPAENQPS